MNYKIKSDGLVIFDKKTFRDLEKKITHIDWVCGLGVELEDGAIFDEEEKDFMIAHNEGLEIIEVG